MLLLNNVLSRSSVVNHSAAAIKEEINNKIYEIYEVVKRQISPIKQRLHLGLPQFLKLSN